MSRNMFLEQRASICDFTFRTWLSQSTSSLGYGGTCGGMGRSPPGCSPHNSMPHQSSPVPVNPFASHQLQGQVHYTFHDFLVSTLLGLCALYSCMVYMPTIKILYVFMMMMITMRDSYFVFFLLYHSGPSGLNYNTQDLSHVWSRHLIPTTACCELRLLCGFISLVILLFLMSLPYTTYYQFNHQSQRHLILSDLLSVYCNTIKLLLSLQSSHFYHFNLV